MEVKMLTCSKCGRTYNSNLNMCPYCNGLGNINSKCTCSHFGNGFEKINIISKRDPKCPIHSKKRN